MTEGAVWLHRKLLDSAIWSCNDATRCGFIACLLLANYKDQQWYSRAEHRQVVIARGSFFTTWEKFISLSGLSKQQTRDCFKTLEDLHIITRRPTQRGTFVSILNYDTYQQIGTQRGTRRATKEEPIRNPLGTQLEEGKEREERKEGRVPASFSISEYVNGWKRRELWDRKEHAVEIAETLKKAGLGFRTQDEIFQQIMGEDANGTVRSQSISEQVAERIKQGKLNPEGKRVGQVVARVRDMPNVQADPETSA